MTLYVCAGFSPVSLRVGEEEQGNHERNRQTPAKQGLSTGIVVKQGDLERNRWTPANRASVQVY